MTNIKMYRADGNGETIRAGGRTVESAIRNAGRKAGEIGRGAYRDIGNLQHFEGGNTYHVQFGTYLKKCNGTTLGDTFVVQVI